LALKASELLENTKLSELRASIARSLSELGMHKGEMSIMDSMEDLVMAPLPVEDALISLFDFSDPTVQQKVIETYISRLYQVTGGPTILSFIFAPRSENTWFA
jgi:acetyl-CoA carboxylase / biotin carboxylase 1